MRNFFRALLQNSLLFVLVVAIVAAVNLLSAKRHSRVDMTDEGEYTLSPATKQILAGLEDRLVVQLYYSKDLPPSVLPAKERINDMIEEVAALAAKPVVIEEIEPDTNAEKEQETNRLGITPLRLTVQENGKFELRKLYLGMVLKYKDGQAVIPELIQANNTRGINLINLEYALALDLLRLTLKDVPKVGLILPEFEDEEPRYQALPHVIAQLGEPVVLNPRNKNLVGMKLKAVVIAEPRELPADFAQEIDDLVADGTNVVLFAASSDVANDLTVTPLTTGLEAWLASKGVSLSEELLLDKQQNRMAAFVLDGMPRLMPYPFWVRFVGEDLERTHPITAEVEEVLLPWTNVVEISPDEDKRWKITPLVTSSKTSFLQESGIETASPDYLDNMMQIPKLANYPVSVILEDPQNASAGRIFLTAGFNAIQDRFLQLAPTNIVFIQNLIEFASLGDKLIGIRSRGKTTRPLRQIPDFSGETLDKLETVGITPANFRSALKWALVLGVPTLAILCGLTVLGALKRRRRKLIADIRRG